MVHVTANEKSYRGIRSKLESGQLSPGDQLVTRQLAAEFGVSLSPIREVINRLASEGLVEHTQGAGAQVKKLNLEDLSELYALRDAIESCAAGLAAELMTTEDREELEHVFAQQQQVAEELAKSSRKQLPNALRSRWLYLEEQFHEMVVNCSRNKLFVKIMRDNRAIGRIFRNHLKCASLLGCEIAAATIEQRRKLMAAFERRDAQLARQLMSDQIQLGRRNVIRLLRDEGMK